MFPRGTPDPDSLSRYVGLLAGACGDSVQNRHQGSNTSRSCLFSFGRLRARSASSSLRPSISRLTYNSGNHEISTRLTLKRQLRTT